LDFIVDSSDAEQLPDYLLGFLALVSPLRRTLKCDPSITYHHLDGIGDQNVPGELIGGCAGNIFVGPPTDRGKIDGNLTCDCLNVGDTECSAFNSPFSYKLPTCPSSSTTPFLIDIPICSAWTLGSQRNSCSTSFLNCSAVFMFFDFLLSEIVL
jgi:hypothetical protein